MRKRFILFLITLLFCTTSVMTQEVPVGVIAAFKKGSSTELSNYLGDKVDLVIQNRPAASDKQGAVQSLMRLFTDNKVSNFNVNHQGKRDESSFIIGTLTTDKGNFRVNCFFKKVQNRYIIHQIRIDKSND